MHNFHKSSNIGWYPSQQRDLHLPNQIYLTSILLLPCCRTIIVGLSKGVKSITAVVVVGAIADVRMQMRQVHNWHFGRQPGAREVVRHCSWPWWVNGLREDCGVSVCSVLLRLFNNMFSMGIRYWLRFLAACVCWPCNANLYCRGKAKLFCDCNRIKEPFFK